MLRFTRCFIVILVLSNVLIFPIQAQDVCGLASRLRIGELGRVMPGDPNNLRAEPSRSSANIGSIAGGGTFVVLDGPICADGAYWWRVNYNGLIGWTVEGSEGMYWIEPVQPICDLQVMLGQPAQTREEVVLYSQPAYQAQELARIPDETQLEVGTDFYCEDEYRAWVTASYQGQMGWLSTRSQFDSGYGGSSSALESRPHPLEPAADASERLLPTPAIELNLSPKAITAVNVQNIELVNTLGEGRMTAFTWSPDGRQIAIATTLEARVYPSHDFNAAPVRLDGHDGNLAVVSYSPDGRYLVTGDTSGRLILRDAASFADMQRLEAGTGILAVRFSPDSRSLAVVLGVNFTTQMIVYHLDGSFTEVYRLPHSSFAPQNSLTFSHDSERLITVDSRSVRVWDNRSGEEVIAIDKGMGAAGIGDWVLSSDEQRITFFYEEMVGDVTQAHYYSLQTWDLETGEGLEGRSTSLALPDRARVTSAVHLRSSYDDSFIWVSAGGSLARFFIEDANAGAVTPPVVDSDVYDFIVSPESDLIAVSGEQGEIRLYERVDSAYKTIQTQTLYGIAGHVTEMQFSPDGAWLAARGSDESLRVWDVTSGQRQGTFTLSGAGAPFDVTGNLVLSGPRLWDQETGQPLEQLSAIDGFRVAVSFRPDGTPIILSRDWDYRALKIWEARTGNLLYRSDSTFLYGFSDDGRYVNLDLTILDTSDFTSINQLSPQYGSAYDALFSPDNRLMLLFDGGLFGVEDTSALLIRDIATGDLLLNYPLNALELGGITWSHDGSVVAWHYQNYDESDSVHRLELLSLETGGVTRSWVINDLPHTPLRFSPDDSMLVLGTNEGNIQFYSRETGELLHSFQAHGGTITQFEFSDDGSSLYTAGDDNTIRIWNIP